MSVIGTQQSPIIITESETWYANVDDKFFYPAYTGKPLAGYLDESNFIFTEFESIKVGGVDWTLRRIHFHSGTEHKLVGQPKCQLEVHLLHTLGTTPEEDPSLVKAKLVIGTFFKIKPKAPSRASFRSLNDALGKAKGATPDGSDTIRDVKINPLDFLPAQKDWPYWFRYEGSLTSGSFSEDVSWFVYKKEAEVSKDEIDKLQCEAKQHVRETYPLNRRFVLRSFL